MQLVSHLAICPKCRKEFLHGDEATPCPHCALILRTQRTPDGETKKVIELRFALAVKLEDLCLRLLAGQETLVLGDAAVLLEVLESLAE